MASDFAYLPSIGTIIAVMAALTVLTGLVNSLSTYWMEKMTKTYIIFHMAVLVSCSIALLTKCEHRHDAKYVFTDVDATSGWTPIGFSWLFGFLSVSWTVRAQDSVSIHWGNEVHVPKPSSPLSYCANSDVLQMTNYDATAQ